MQVKYTPLQNRSSDYSPNLPNLYNNLIVNLIFTLIVVLTINGLIMGLGVYFVNQKIAHLNLRNLEGERVPTNAVSDKSLLLAVGPYLDTSPLTPYSRVPTGGKYGFFYESRPNSPVTYHPNRLASSIELYLEANSEGVIDYKNSQLEARTSVDSTLATCWRCTKDGFYGRNITSETATFRNLTVDHMRITGPDTLIVDYRSLLNILEVTGNSTMNTTYTNELHTPLLFCDRAELINTVTQTISVAAGGTINGTVNFQIIRATKVVIPYNNTEYVVGSGTVNTTEITCMTILVLGTLDAVYARLTTLNVESNLTIGKSGNYSDVLKVNRIESVGDNDDLYIDAKRKIILDTLTDGGVRMRTLNSGGSWLANMAYSLDNATVAVVYGVFNNGGFLRPGIGTHQLDGNEVAIDWSYFYLNYGQRPGLMCTIVGSENPDIACSNGVNNNAFYTTGNVQASGNSRADIFIAATKYQIGNTDVLSMNGPNVKLGVLTFPITYGSNNQFLQSDGLGNVNWSSNLTVTGVISETGSFTSLTSTTSAFDSITATRGTFGTSGLYTDGIKTNLLTSVGAGDDMIIEKLDGGHVIIKTIINGGFQMRAVDNGNWITGSFFQTGGTSAAVAGSFLWDLGAGNSEWRSGFGGHLIDPSTGNPINWDFMYLNWGQIPGTHCVIVGNTIRSVAIANSNAMYITGNMETSNDFRAVTLILSNLLRIGSTDVVQLNGLDVKLGGLTFPTSIFGISGQFLKGDGLGGVSWSNVTIPDMMSTTDTLTLDFLLAGNGAKTAKVTSLLSSNIPTSASTLTADNLIVGDGLKAIKTTTIPLSTVVTHPSPLTSTQFVLGGGGSDISTTSLLTVTAGVLEATAVIHSTLRIATDSDMKIGNTNLVSDGVGQIHFPVVTGLGVGSVMVDTMWATRLKRIRFTPSEQPLGCTSPATSCEFYRGNV